MFNISLLQVENGYTIMVSTEQGCETYVATDELSASALIKERLLGNAPIKVSTQPVNGARFEPTKE